GPRRRDECGDVGPARDVDRCEGYAAGEAPREVGAIGEPVGAAPDVDQMPARAGGIRGLDHRHERGDDAAAGAEEVLNRVLEREVFAEPGYRDGVARLQSVEPARTATTVRLEQDRDAPTVRVCGHATQRVLARVAVVDCDIDVTSGMPLG